jgi:hypothetical protein
MTLVDQRCRRNEREKACEHERCKTPTFQPLSMALLDADSRLTLSRRNRQKETEATARALALGFLIMIVLSVWFTLSGGFMHGD